MFKVILAIPNCRVCKTFKDTTSHNTHHHTHNTHHHTHKYTSSCTQIHIITHTHTHTHTKQVKTPSVDLSLEKFDIPIMEPTKTEPSFRKLDTPPTKLCRNVFFMFW